MLNRSDENSAKDCIIQSYTESLKSISQLITKIKVWKSKWGHIMTDKSPPSFTGMDLYMYAQQQLITYSCLKDF